MYKCVTYLEFNNNLWILLTINFVLKVSSEFQLHSIIFMTPLHIKRDRNYSNKLLNFMFKIEIAVFCIKSMLSLSSDFQVKVVDSHAKNIKIMDSWKAHAWAAKIINSKIAINLKLQSWWYFHSDYKWWNDFSPSTVYASVSQPLDGWGATSNNKKVLLSNCQNLATI